MAADSLKTLNGGLQLGEESAICLHPLLLPSPGMETVTREAGHWTISSPSWIEALMATTEIETGLGMAMTGTVEDIRTIETEEDLGVRPGTATRRTAKAGTRRQHLDPCGEVKKWTVVAWECQIGDGTRHRGPDASRSQEDGGRRNARNGTWGGIRLPDLREEQIGTLRIEMMDWMWGERSGRRSKSAWTETGTATTTKEQWWVPFS
jgi:hypothetical protein